MSDNTKDLIDRFAEHDGLTRDEEIADLVKRARFGKHKTRESASFSVERVGAVNNLVNRLTKWAENRRRHADLDADLLDNAIEVCVAYLHARGYVRSANDVKRIVPGISLGILEQVSNTMHEMRKEGIDFPGFGVAVVNLERITTEAQAVNDFGAKFFLTEPPMEA